MASTIVIVWASPQCNNSDAKPLNRKTDQKQMYESDGE
jgi:hypothetical protein